MRLKSTAANIVWRLPKIGQSSRRCRRRRTPLKLELRSTGGRRSSIAQKQLAAPACPTVCANRSINFQSFVWRRDGHTPQRKHVAAIATWTEYSGASWSTGERTGRKWSSNSFTWKTIRRWVPFKRIYQKKKKHVTYITRFTLSTNGGDTSNYRVGLQTWDGRTRPEHTVSAISVIGVIRPPRKRVRLSRLDEALLYGAPSPQIYLLWSAISPYMQIIRIL